MDTRTPPTPQQIMERQIRMIDRILDQASEPSAKSTGEGAK